MGGCTLEAAEEVCAHAEGLSVDVLDGLSLAGGQESCCVRGEGPAGEPRFTMLETIREYAQERLAQSGAGGCASAVAHAGHFRALAEQRSHLVIGPAGGWLARLEREHDNLRAALGWAQESSQDRAEVTTRE